MLQKKEKINFEWLKEVDSTALQQSIKNMDKAYQGFFKLKRGYPKFKNRHHSRQSYQTITAKMKEKKLFLAEIGLIEIRGFREFDGELKTVTQNSLLKNVLVVVIYLKRIERVKVNLDVLNVILNLMPL